MALAEELYIMWSIIASVLVFIHLSLELAHYVYDYFAARRGKNILVDIQRHRMRSRKTAMLVKMQKDLDSIKEKLGIKEKSIDLKIKIKQYGLPETYPDEYPTMPEVKPPKRDDNG